VTRVQVYGEYIFFFKEEDMSQETKLETRLKAMEARVEAIENSPLMSIANKLFPAGSPMEEEILSSLESLVGMTSLEDLFEESRTLLDAGTPLKAFNAEVL